MALLKSIDTGRGVEAAYWRIVARTDDYDARTIRLDLHGYYSEKARRDGNAPLLDRVVIIELAEGQTSEQFGRIELYALLKVHAPPLPAMPAIVEGERVLLRAPTPPAMFAEAADILEDA